MPTPTDLRPVRWLYDQLRDAFSPRQTPRSAPGAGIFDPPYTCVVLNKEWASHIIGVVDTLAWVDAWAGDDGEIESAIQEVEKFLALLAVGECNMVQDVRITDDCHLEVMLVDGEWYDRGALCCCSPSVPDFTVIDDVLGAAEDRYGDADINNPRSVNSEAPDLTFSSASDDTGDDGEMRELALCEATRRMVNALCDGAIEAVERGQGVVSIAATALSGGAVLVSAAFTGGASLALIGATSVAAGTLAQGFISTGQELQIMFLQDQDKRDEIACCWYQYLKDKSVTFANFSAQVLDAECYDGTNEAGEIINAIHSAITDQQFYFAFLDLLAYSTRDAEDGLASCDCDEEESIPVPWYPLSWSDSFVYEDIGDCQLRIRGYGHLKPGGVAFTPTDGDSSTCAMVEYVSHIGRFYIGDKATCKKCGDTADHAIPITTLNHSLWRLGLTSNPEAEGLEFSELIVRITAV